VTSFVDKMTALYFKQLRRASKGERPRPGDDEDSPPEDSDDLAP
jgi:hypothetical protein